LWDNARGFYMENQPKDGRVLAAAALEAETSWMYVLESERLWSYDADRGFFLPDGAARAHRLLEKELGGHYTITERNEIVDKLKARHQTHRSDLNAKDADKPLLCVGNGVVDLSNGELLPHEPKYKFTRGLAWDYNEYADATPVLEFLDGITKRPEDRDTLIDHLAHGLMPGHPYRAFVMTYGPGGNGKTQLGELFRGFVGEENAAAVELQDLTGGDDFATGALPSAFINVGDDVSVGEIRNTSTLKTASGGGTLRANEKHEKKFDFKNEAALFFSANEPPRIKEDKQSIADRLYPIEMPYRHVDDPDPDNPNERKKVPGISEKLLSDEDAMEGLLKLAVEHAQELIRTDGQYSMPEGPKGRRDIYEAASDPIRRFALEMLEAGGGNDVIIKEDAYRVYTNLCDRDSERAAQQDVFKRKISQQSIVDVESSQTRKLTPGDDRPTCWKYVRFTENAKSCMAARLKERYFPDDEANSDEGDESSDESTPEIERAAFGAEPVRDAAKSLTGYVTVTIEIVDTRRLGENESGLKAIVKDASGAMDVVAWDHNSIDALEDLEGECAVIQNAEVSEYNGSHQLSTVEGLTDVRKIQQGVGYTETVAPEDVDDSGQQSGLKDATQAETDGGQEFDGCQPKILEALRLNGDMSLPELVAEIDQPPATIEGHVRSLRKNGRVMVDGEGDEMTVRRD